MASGWPNLRCRRGYVSRFCCERSHNATRQVRACFLTYCVCIRYRTTDRCTRGITCIPYVRREYIELRKSALITRCVPIISRANYHSGNIRRSPKPYNRNSIKRKRMGIRVTVVFELLDFHYEWSSRFLFSTNAAIYYSLLQCMYILRENCKFVWFDMSLAKLCITYTETATNILNF